MGTKTPLSPLDQLHHDITEALAELRGARAEYQHSPNADTHVMVEYAELRLNKLIDRRTQTGGKAEPVKSR